MSAMSHPQNTYALVVGIEKYNAGSEWDLDGPAQDAGRFTRWLLDRQIPRNNIALFASALDEPSFNQKTGNLAFMAPTHQNLYQKLTSDLPEKKGDLLFIFWGGHGVITPEGHRRLFYADATANNLRNLDLNLLSTFLRSEYYSGFERQIWIVDACANFIYDPRQEKALPWETFPTPSPRTLVDQFILLAANPGQLALNLDEKKTGVFSRAVLEELAHQPPGSWPPDFKLISETLEQKFVALRQAGLVDQTPVHYWNRDWLGNENTFSEVKGVSIKAEGVAKDLAGTVPIRDWPKFSFDAKKELVNKLLACPSMSLESGRRSVLSNLNFTIKHRIPEDPVPVNFVMNIVTTCQAFPGGLHELVNIIEFYEGRKSEPYKNLINYLETYQDFEPEQPAMPPALSPASSPSYNKCEEAQVQRQVQAVLN
jgi:hypothetical protein